MTIWWITLTKIQIAHAPRASAIHLGRVIPNRCHGSPHNAIITSTGMATCNDLTIKNAISHVNAESGCGGIEPVTVAIA